MRKLNLDVEHCLDRRETEGGVESHRGRVYQSERYLGLDSEGSCVRREDPCQVGTEVTIERIAVAMRS